MNLDYCKPGEVEALKAQITALQTELSRLKAEREDYAAKIAQSWPFEKEPLFENDPQLGRWAAVTAFYTAIGAVLECSEDEAAEWFKNHTMLPIAPPPVTTKQGEG